MYNVMTEDNKKRFKDMMNGVCIGVVIGVFWAFIALKFIFHLI